jgi:hypothetical protein
MELNQKELEIVEKIESAAEEIEQLQLSFVGGGIGNVLMG